MAITPMTIAFIALVVVGIGMAAFGKWRLNNTLMIVGGILVLAGFYCLISGMYSA